jgi:CHAD domain-containing protein
MKNEMQTLPENDSPQPILVLVERLDSCRQRYRTELKRTRAEFAEEYIHDLRVAIRRLMAAIDMGRAIVHKKKMKKSRRLLKSHLGAFDKLRDTQVQLSLVEEMQAELAEIVPYRDHLREREKELGARLKKKIKEFSSTGLSHQVRRLKTALLAQNTPETESALWSVLDDAYAAALEHRATVRPEDAATIHQLRLAFKKFRYRVESIHPVLAGAPEDLLRRLHDYQAAMGEVQDAEVGLQMLDSFTAESGETLTAVRARFIEMHQARIAAFLSQMDDLATFWRQTPDDLFPWEMKKPLKKKRQIKNTDNAK